MNHQLLFTLSFFFWLNISFTQSSLEEILNQSTDFNKICSEAENYFRQKSNVKSLKELASGEHRDGEYVKFCRWRNYWNNHLGPDGSIVDITKYKNEARKKSKNFNTSPFAGISWNNISNTNYITGQISMGRTTSLAFHPTDPNTFYVGAAIGGIWKTTDGGQNYTPLGDELPFLAVSSIVLDQVNPNIIYIAISDHLFYGPPTIGVYKSIDGGLTWNETALTFNFTSLDRIYWMVADPANQSKIFVASSDGLFLTTDGFSTVSKVNSIDCSEIHFKPGDNNTIYLGSRNGGFYKSTNGGTSFSNITSFGSSYVRIAVSSINPQLVYATHSNRLYKSSNSGSSFPQSDGLPESEMVISFSPKNTNELLIGNFEIYQSTNGGQNFNQITQWLGNNGLPLIHVDQRNIFVNPLQNNLIYFNNDGGLYTYNVDNDQFTDLSDGLIITQYYDIATSQTNANIVSGGSQDNGSMFRNSQGEWEEFAPTADGMDTEIDPTNENIIYWEIQFGGMNRYDGNSSVRIAPPGKYGRGVWETPYRLDPSNPNRIICAFDRVYESFDRGDNWTDISGVLSNGENLDHVAISKSDGSRVYVVKQSSLFVGNTNNNTWTRKECPSGIISDIEVDPNNEDILYISYNRYRLNTKVFMSTDAGDTWINLSAGLANVPVNAIEINELSSGSLFAGTDAGVYYRNNANTEWQEVGNLPNTSVTDVEIQYSSSLIRVGTHGRGIYEASFDLDANDPIVDTQSPSTPSNLTANNITQSSVNLSWSASTDNVGVTGYNVLSGSTIIATVTGTSHTVSGLAASTSYTFSIVALDAAGNQSSASNSVTVTTLNAPDTQSPSAPSNLTANNITQTSVDLNWNASSDNVGVTNYRILNGSNIVATVSGTSHTVTGLTASTSYTYSVVALDAAGNQSSASNSVNVTTLSAPDTQSPSTPSNLTANNITQSSVDLSWSASTDNVGVTGYNVLSGSTIIATVTGTNHTVTGLAAITSYTFSVVALDAAGNQSSASSVTVTTLNATDTQSPSTPSNLTANNITQSSVNLSWSASTDNVAVTGYNVLSGSTIIATVTGTNHTVSGLTPNTSYTYSVIALDAAGNQSSASNSVTVTTLNVTTPEYCEASVAQDANVINRVQLASIDNSSNWGTNGYEDFRGISTNLEKGTTYTLTISPEHDHWPAVDVQVWIDWNQNGVFDSSERVYAKRGSGPFSGNITVPTNAVNGNTGMRVRLAYNRSPDPCGFDNYQGEVEDYTVNITGSGGGSDTQAPSAPTNLTASGVTQSSVNLNWNASSDNVGVTSYRILSGSNIVANVSGTNHSVTGLTANTSYTYRVVALDAAGNQSSASNIVSITTLSASDTQAPSAPTNLAASGITQSSVNLSWNTSSDNIGVTGYNVLSGSTIIATVTGTNYTVTGLQSNTNYAYSVVAFDAAGNQSNNSNTVNVTTLDVTTPDYCEASVAQDANVIERVQLGSIDNSSNWGANGYQDHSTVSTDLAKGATYTLTISPEHDHWPAVDVQVWIDWNQNGVFDSSERVYAKRGSGPFSGNITVPTNAVNGNTGMRVRLAYNRSPGPCGFDNYQGEVEDYTVNIVSQSNFISSDNKVSLDVKKLKNAIHAYPNPTEGVFQIQTESGSSISIFNQAGKMVYEMKSSGTINEINLATSPGGLYFIKVNNSKGTLTTKLIVLN